MHDLVVTTWDWVPDGPRGFVRDLRLCWALEEAGLPYRVATVPFDRRDPSHYAYQPFWAGALADRWRCVDLRKRCRAAAYLS